jgi:ABC-type glycerol-3-phosphate transport system substrate-binding protein
MMPLWVYTIELLPRYDKTVSKSITSDPVPEEWTWDEAIEWFQADLESNDTEMFLMEPAGQFLSMLLAHNISYFYEPVYDVVDFDSPVLHEIINVVKRLYEGNRLNGIDYQTGSVDYQQATNLMTNFPFGDSVTDFASLTSSYGQFYPYPVIPGTEGKSVSIESMYSICAASSTSAKAAAWEFIKIFISDEIQNGSLIWNGASPVISELNREGVARLKNSSSYFSTLSEDAMKRLTDEVTDDDIFKFNEDRRAYYDNVNRLAYIPENGVFRVIQTNATPYIEGEIDFDVCISNMKSSWETVRE